MLQIFSRLSWSLVLSPPQPQAGSNPWWLLKMRSPRRASVFPPWTILFPLLLAWLRGNRPTRHHLQQRWPACAPLPITLVLSVAATTAQGIRWDLRPLRPQKPLEPPLELLLQTVDKLLTWSGPMACTICRPFQAPRHLPWPGVPSEELAGWIPWLQAARRRGILSFLLSTSKQFLLLLVFTALWSIWIVESGFLALLMFTFLKASVDPLSVFQRTCANLIFHCGQERKQQLYVSVSLHGWECKRDILRQLPDNIEEGHGCLWPQQVDGDLLVTSQCCLPASGTDAKGTNLKPQPRIKHEPVNNFSTKRKHVYSCIFLYILVHGSLKGATICDE